MRHFSLFLFIATGGLLMGAPLSALQTNRASARFPAQPARVCQDTQEAAAPNFLAIGGGGAPGYNEIALEKNVLYFQRTLRSLGYNPTEASIFFANGNDGQSTVRYMNPQGLQNFKAPEIPDLDGAATLANFQNWMQQTSNRNPDKPIFFYFTGHGLHNDEDDDNNALILWEEELLSVRQLATMLDRLPSQTPVVTMMAQCYSGSFANVIYEGGDPNQPVALSTRCGFFATIQQLPSVGCTPEVNEEDYDDYSSSFFAGLSGISRTGKKVASADYNNDGRVSYSEAHAFAKVDEQTMDLPVSTVEVWLQRKASSKVRTAILGEPVAEILKTARPEQRYVVQSLAKGLNVSPEKSLSDYLSAGITVETNEQKALVVRLGMELVNIGMELRLRQSGNVQDITTLDRLIACEGSSWNKQ